MRDQKWKNLKLQGHNLNFIFYRDQNRNSLILQRPKEVLTLTLKGRNSPYSFASNEPIEILQALLPFNAFHRIRR